TTDSAWKQPDGDLQGLREFHTKCDAETGTSRPVAFALLPLGGRKMKQSEEFFPRNPRLSDRVANVRTKGFALAAKNSGALDSCGKKRRAEWLRHVADAAIRHTVHRARGDVAIPDGIFGDSPDAVV